MSTCLFIDSNAIWISVDQGKFSPHMAATELPNPNTKNIGTDKNSKMNDNITAKENIRSSHLREFLDKWLLAVLMKTNPL